MIKARRILLFFSMIALIAFSGFFISLELKEANKVGFLIVNPGESQLIIKKDNLIINAWDSYGVSYFFIPSYARISSLSYELSVLKMYTPDGVLLEYPEFNTIQAVLVDTGNGEKAEYRVAFCQSANLYSLYIDTKGHGIENVSRDEYIPVSLNLFTPKGVNVYSEANASLKGRGNWNWVQTMQKSYQLLLPEDTPIEDMTKSKLWALLPNSNDKSRMCNKLAMDTSSAMGMEYTIESDWVDVFIDGLYWGNYLICHEPHISRNDLNIHNLEKLNKDIDDSPESIDTATIKAFRYNNNPDDITGGYLFCIDQYPQKRSSGFWFSDDIFVQIKSPDNASLNQAEYIRSFMGDIDKELKNGEDNNIDYYSFARRYIIDELFLNLDHGAGSYYFYKKSKANTVYAGPLWDYDGALVSRESADLTRSVIDPDFAPEDETPIAWDEMLMNRKNYRNYVEDTFRQYNWLWDYILTRQLDSYYERISDSLNMSYLRWIKIDTETDVGEYPPPEYCLDCLKSNLSVRLEYLSGQWDPDTSSASSAAND